MSMKVMIILGTMKNFSYQHYNTLGVTQQKQQIGFPKTVRQLL